MVLRTLGGLALEGNDFQRRKPLLLLAYLALEGTKSRRMLAGLFWPDAADPRDSLSKAVQRLNAVDGGLLEIRGGWLDTSLPCDAAEFRKLVLGANGAAASALRRYAGPFLHGVDVEVGHELEEWILDTREHLAACVRTVYFDAARRALRMDDRALARRHAEDGLDVLAAPPFDPRELHGVLDLLAAAGSPRLHEVAREAQELGLDPQAGSPAEAVAAVGARVVALPHTATTFVGRGSEMATLTELLSADTPRLVTLHGPGGAGKSRLAVEAARRLLDAGRFADGAAFVSLEEVHDTALVPMAIADALGASTASTLPVELQVLSLVGARELLLVLDNAEHLTGCGPYLARLLAECPRVRLLVTSRHTLDLAEEHVVRLDGLPVGHATEEGNATRLLLDRVCQLQPDFEPDPDDDLNLERIARLVHGMPLGLELAATWIHALPLHELADAIAADLALLERRDGNVPERLRGLRTAFDISWRLLEDRDRRVLRRLSVFRGGFRREAAAAIAGADLPALARLIDRALVRTTLTGRYERHPLIHQFTAEKLAEHPDEERETRERHARWFLAETQRHGDGGEGGPNVRESWAWITEEFPNLQAAWDTLLALDDPPHEELSDVILSLTHYGEQRARYREVLELYRRVPPDLPPLLDAEITAATSWLAFRVGEIEAAMQASSDALRVLEPEPPALVWRGLWSAHEGAMGALATTGAFDRAEAAAHACIDVARGACARAASDAEVKEAEIAHGTSINALAWVLTFAGRFDEAREATEQSAALLRKHRSGNLAYILDLMGQLDLAAGDAAKAREDLLEGVAEARRAGFETQEAQLLGDLAQAQLVLGELTAAEAACHAGLAITRNNGNRWHETMLLATHGRVLLAAAKEPDALARLAEAARVGLNSGHGAFAAEALVGLAQHHLEHGRPDDATDVLRAVLAEPSAPAAAKLIAQGVAGAAGLRLDGTPARSMQHWLERLADPVTASG